MFSEGDNLFPLPQGEGQGEGEGGSRSTMEDHLTSEKIVPHAHVRAELFAERSPKGPYLLPIHSTAFSMIFSGIGWV
jgi:hypothetical protein